MKLEESDAEVRWLLALLGHLIPDGAEHDEPGAARSGIVEAVRCALRTVDHDRLFLDLNAAVVHSLGRSLSELSSIDLPAVINSNRELWKRYIRLVGPVILTEYFSSDPVRLALGLRIGPPVPDGSILPEIDTDLLMPVFCRDPIFKDAR